MMTIPFFDLLIATQTDQTPDEDDDWSKYILQASFDGRLKSDEGFLSATGDLATLTAASGRIFI